MLLLHGDLTIEFCMYVFQLYSFSTSYFFLTVCMRLFSFLFTQYWTEKKYILQLEHRNRPSFCESDIVWCWRMFYVQSSLSLLLSSAHDGEDDVFFISFDYSSHVTLRCPVPVYKLHLLYYRYWKALALSRLTLDNHTYYLHVKMCSFLMLAASCCFCWCFFYYP